MSAGGLSYSGLINYGKATLPSVDSWGTNMNILRDPPKSIHTRRIDKVGQTSDITEMIDESGNRACEAINVYARGINPFVSVSYSNEGNNGGQRTSGLTIGGQVQAKLPYTVIKDGAFRPPVLLQEDTVPLSRLPRVWTTAYTNPAFPDFSKKMKTCGTDKDTKEVRNDVIKTFIRPTAVYQMETPIAEPFEVKYVIQPTINRSVTSGLRSLDYSSQEVKIPTKEINMDVQHAFANSNLSNIRHVDNTTVDTIKYIQDIQHKFANSNISDIRHMDNTTVDTLKYIQDTNTHSVATNLGAANAHHTPIDEILDLGDIRTKDLRTVSYITPVSGNKQTEYIHKNIELERNLPEHMARTNIVKNIHKQSTYDNTINLERNTPLTHYAVNPTGKGENNTSSRNYSLQQKIQPGGYAVPGQMPMLNRMQEVNEQYESDKARMSRLVLSQAQNRFLR